MNPETPVLMIALQIPVLEDTSVDQVLDAIGQKVSQALEEIRKQRSSGESEALRLEEKSREQEELHTVEMEPDLLAQLGYAA